MTKSGAEGNIDSDTSFTEQQFLVNMARIEKCGDTRQSADAHMNLASFYMEQNDFHSAGTHLWDAHVYMQDLRDENLRFAELCEAFAVRVCRTQEPRVALDLRVAEWFSEALFIRLGRSLEVATDEQKRAATRAEYERLRRLAENCTLPLSELAFDLGAAASADGQHKEAAYWYGVALQSNRLSMSARVEIEAHHALSHNGAIGEHAVLDHAVAAVTHVAVCTHLAADPESPSSVCMARDALRLAHASQIGGQWQGSLSGEIHYASTARDMHIAVGSAAGIAESDDCLGEAFAKAGLATSAQAARGEALALRASDGIFESSYEARKSQIRNMGFELTIRLGVAEVDSFS